MQQIRKLIEALTELATILHAKCSELVITRSSNGVIAQGQPAFVKIP